MIAVLDFGSQYTQLIIRKIREAGVYCESFPCSVSMAELLTKLGADSLKSVSGFVLSGGPSSVFEKNAPRCDPAFFRSGRPLLGICYGMQLMTHLLGGRVKPAKKREYGRAALTIKDASGLFKGVPKKINVWMSHGDSVLSMPAGFRKIASTPSTELTAIADESGLLYGVQFHPEVANTDYGSLIIKNFLYKVCGLKPDRGMKSFITEEVKRIKGIVGSNRVILGLSGGVDSSVAAAILHKAIGKNLYSIFVDNGLLRQGESEKVIKTFKKLFGKSFNLVPVNAERLFLKNLRKISDPERKRKIIGRTFIKIFEKESKKIKGAKFLGQGTLYPDFIESVSVKGPSATIKTHHNVGGLPKKMKLSLIEPLKYFFKDEVRTLGKELGLPDDILYRHPFPGPGLAIRILGDITSDRLSILRRSDSIVIEEIKKAGLYRELWQAFAVLLPTRTVGVMGDMRTYEHVIALRMVKSTDAMTADWAKVPYDVLGKISNRIINEVRGVNRVVYDISSKPPATIEWE